MAIFQMVTLGCASLLIMALLKRRLLRVLTALPLTILMSLQWLSYFTHKLLFDQQMLNLLNFSDIVLMSNAYLKWYLLLASSSIIYFLLLLLVSRKLREFLSERATKIIAPLALLGVALLCLPGGVIPFFARAVDGYLVMKRDHSFAQVMYNLGLEPTAYVPLQKLKVSGPATKKNIVIISLESFEKVFLDRTDLTPGLNNLRKNWTYFENFPPSLGANTTIEAMYAWHTGLPAYFSFNPEFFFKNSMTNKVASIPAVLKLAGYSACFIGSRPEFAGTDDFLKTLGYDTIKGYQADLPATARAFSFDSEIFELAKKEISRLSSDNSPFLLTISTIDTHFPWLIYPLDDKMHAAGLSGSEEEQLIQWTDHLIVDFIAYIHKLGILDDTLVFIMPDHPVRGKAPVKSPAPSYSPSLYLLTNTPADKFSLKTKDMVRHYDLPRMLLDASGIKNNAVFLKDMVVPKIIGKNDFMNWITQHRYSLVALNKALWERDDVTATIKKYNNTYTLQMGSFQQTMECPPDKVLFFDLGSYLRVGKVRHYLGKPEDGFLTIERLVDSGEINVSGLDRTLWVLLEPKKNSFNISVAAFSPYEKNFIPDNGVVSFQFLEFLDLNRKKFSYPNAGKNFHHNPEAFIAHAGGGIDGQSYTNSLEAMRLAIHNGFKYIELDLIETTDGYLVGGHDWEHFNKITGHAELGNTALSLAEAKQRKIFGKYMPVSDEDIMHFMRLHPDIFIVTDKIQDFPKLAERIPHTWRLLVEANGLYTYEQGPSSNIYNRTCYVGSLENLHKAKQEGVKMITVSSKFMEENEAEFEQAYNDGMVILVYGGADTEEYFTKYMGRTMSMYYTDFWSVKAGKRTQ